MCIVYVYEHKQMRVTAHGEDGRKISRSEYSPFAVGSKNQTQLVRFVQVKQITFTCCAVSTFLPVVISFNSQLHTL